MLLLLNWLLVDLMADRVFARVEDVGKIESNSTSDTEGKLSTV